METTHENSVKEILTIEDLKKAATAIHKIEEPPLKSNLSWFTKIMNRFGWHRKYEVIVFDRSQFGGMYPPRVSYLERKKEM